MKSHTVHLKMNVPERMGFVNITAALPMPFAKAACARASAWSTRCTSPPDFGPWEQVFYGEFDGRREKRVLVKVIGE